MLRRLTSQIYTINRRICHNRSKQTTALFKYPNKLLSTSSATRLLHNQSDPYSSGNALFGRLREDASKSNLVELTFKELVQYSRASQLFTSSHDNIDETYLIESAEYIRKQLTILLARVIIDFQNLPYGVADNLRIEQIMQTYIDSYTAIKQTNVLKSVLDKQEFDETIQKHLASWTQISVVPSLCLGLLEMAQERALSQIEECPYLSNFIDRIVVRRLAARILLGHYVALHENRFGIFEENEIIEHIETAKNDALTAANKVYDDTMLLPKITIYDQRKNMNNSFIFSGKMLHQFTFELLKNSIRATMEYHHRNGKEHDIKIIVVNSMDGDITIKIADHGGGISRNEMNKIWLYSYTQSRDKNNNNTIDRCTKNQMEVLAKATVDKYAVTHNPYYIGAILHENVPMYGLGYGLPLIKAYSKYFGGDCTIHSIENYGTDAYLFVPTLATSHSNVLSVG
eukprot:451967_1